MAPDFIRPIQLIKCLEERPLHFSLSISLSPSLFQITNGEHSKKKEGKHGEVGIKRVRNREKWLEKNKY